MSDNQQPQPQPQPCPGHVVKCGKCQGGGKNGWGQSCEVCGGVGSVLLK